MKPILTLLASLLLVPGAFAQGVQADTQTRERACMTWLSLASRFATSEEQRSTFDQQYLRLNRVVTAGTDVVAEAASAEDPVANKSYDDWVMKFDLAEDAARAAMVDEVVGHALDCADVVPEEVPATTAQ